ncbi:MAG: putative rRNA maturation factor [Tepidanaerobacteraceae bacterium]|nr:putative rRNA maturation factor [Tepidanaerobacteraceae bacterium]
MAQIIINNLQDKIKVDRGLEELITKAVELTLNLEGADTKVEVSVALVDNAYIRELNKTYRGKYAPTDVLSFPIGEESLVDENEEIERLLGDIVVSLEKAEEQANDYGHSFEREVIYLIVHGTLHLLGYDHENEEERKVMREKEERTLKALGLPREESRL